MSTPQQLSGDPSSRWCSGSAGATRGGFGGRRPSSDIVQVMTHEVRRLRSQSLTRGLLRCGVAAGPVFVTVFLLEGARRADYNSLRHPVSALSLGPHGWTQVTNFGAVGTLCLAGAAGLFRAPDADASTRLGSLLIGAAGVGLLGSAVFATDPVSGYPPGPADESGEDSTSMTLHGLASIPIVVGLPSSALAYAWRFHRGGRPRWALYCAASAASMVATFGLAGAGFGQRPTLVNLAGLFQRASIITAFGWISALSARSLQHIRQI
jgi:hypothetical protein